MDNFFNSCPPKMSDRRYLTDHNIASTREQYVQAQYEISSAFDYSEEITAHGNKVAKETFKHMIQDNVGKCVGAKILANNSTKTYAEMLTTVYLGLEPGKCGIREVKEVYPSAGLKW